MIPRVLFVGNDRERESLLRDVFQAAFEIVSVPSDRDALELLERETCFAVVADVDHCDGDGRELLRRFKVPFARLAICDEHESVTRSNALNTVGFDPSWLRRWAVQSLAGREDLDEGECRALSTLRKMLARPKEDELAARLGVEPNALGWADRLRVAPHIDIDDDLEGEILAHGRAAVPTLLAILDDPNECAAAKAADLLIELRAPEAIEPLASIVCVPSLRSMRLRRLAELGEAVVEPILRAVEKVKDPWSLPAQVLVETGVRDERIFRLLVALVADNPDSADLAAAYGDARIVPTLLGVLDRLTRPPLDVNHVNDLETVGRAIRDLGGEPSDELRSRVIDRFIEGALRGLIHEALPDPRVRDMVLDRLKSDSVELKDLARRFRRWGATYFDLRYATLTDHDLVWAVGRMWMLVLESDGTVDRETAKRHEAEFAELYELRNFGRGGAS